MMETRASVEGTVPTNCLRKIVAGPAAASKRLGAPRHFSGLAGIGKEHSTPADHTMHSSGRGLEASSKCKRRSSQSQARGNG